MSNNDTTIKAPPKIVRVPGSKSLTQRALIAAALARDNSFIANPLISEDTNYLLEGLRLLGAQIVSVSGGFYVNGTAGKLANTGQQIFLGNNGTALRFLTALVCLGEGRYILTGEKRLCERPVGALVEALQKMGVEITCTNNCPPVTVDAHGLAGGKITLKDVESSQYVSALLLCAPYTRKGIELTLRGRVSSLPYIDLTLEVMREFGIKIERQKSKYIVQGGKCYQGREYRVEGDASSASYFFLAAALLQRPIRVLGINRLSCQGDIRLLEILEKLGCHVQSQEDWVEVTGNTLAHGDFTFDLNDMPDMVPTLAVLAAFRRGKTTITNVEHLRIKESNRLAAMAAELNRAGIKTKETADGLIISGGQMKAADIQTYNDHRIAMSFAVASLAAPGIEIADKKCVDKSFPEFWEELAKI
ncbi:MAG TPA: 3-phosphoshikimate 1-carboxyvinyltransferase [Smithellaceae bacterium]|nr:3-phosphoshikimate 1-carboxyvinyltransferase [Smithellaceae bacterium]HRS88889.1 3-phosphoshikimate 1-carboxyvinyltransferase [Smithellaceae bacterium]HRV26228.1 3-phosphoshikimate 1-carboxyvinyltransferase [Smithellaceae bacterium]